MRLGGLSGGLPGLLPVEYSGRAGGVAGHLPGQACRHTGELMAEVKAALEENDAARTQAGAPRLVKDA